MTDIVDRIDELVDEQLANYDRRSGYDHNVNQVWCPHCYRTWHGLAITERIEQMRHRGEMDPDYRYSEDDSTVYCPGSDFIGPMADPLQLAWMRADTETQALYPEGRLPSINATLSAAMQLGSNGGYLLDPEFPPEVQFPRPYPYILPGPSLGVIEQALRAANLRNWAEWNIENTSDPAPCLLGPDITDGDRVSFVSTNGFRYEGIARVEHRGLETVIHIEETDESTAARTHAIRGGRTPSLISEDLPDSPQQCALPRPSTQPPMWANNPTRTNRRRNR
ncbi:hypothetical protein [Rhodococcus sp. AH-ZY2]|uniref:hypothetical protein n=1 Tax=Rhodococcus sp. AH-ZY2 TaxID=3047468 RepID=UPI0027E06315|nr:hypothetical protein [Rhodococcus sp. AH-ZY2]WML63640.1 hypothetical protein QNA09_02140 [Rhodococcus sp. AH-ZY2]